MPAYREHTIIGPPGCGKTTYLARVVEKAVGHGLEPLVASLTRAAAAEAAGRALPIPRESVGTLHAHCYRALGEPPICNTSAILEEWNQDYPHLRLTAEHELDNDLVTVSEMSRGDRLMSEYQCLRARMTPRESWRNSVRKFASLWETFCQEHDGTDFTGLIERCLTSVTAAPGYPDAIFVDEAQDLSQLEMALVRHWASAAKHLIITGDPDQNLYQWRGTDAHAFTLADSPKILNQSYRVPQAVHQRALRWITRDRTRRPVTYYPANHPGQVRHISAHWKTPQMLINDAARYLDQGKSVMFLVSCSYMLEPMIRELRNRGLPFHNPYRRRQYQWNPLRRVRNGVSSRQRMLAFLNHVCNDGWTATDLEHWTAAVRLAPALNVRRDDIEALASGYQDRTHEPLDYELLSTLLTEEAIDAGLGPDLNWFERNLLKNMRDRMEYPLRIARKQGYDTLAATPQIIVGTIHSTKGGEADVVYLFPDLSIQGYRNWLGAPRERAAIYRLYYVGMTRAKETLVIPQPRNRAAVSF